MTLLDALQKSNIVPESVIATRDGEMILEDEILKEGDVIKLVAVISGGCMESDVSRRRLQSLETLQSCKRESYEMP